MGYYSKWANSASHFYRLGGASVLNAAKILSASATNSAPGCSALFASSNGRAFTAKYYHTLQQKQQNSQNNNGILSATAITKSSSVISTRPMSGHGDHVKLWTAERILSGALVPIIPLALIMPCAPLDCLLAFGLTVHSHWGIEAIVVDYVRPSVFGETIPKVAVAMVYGLSAMTLGGLFYFIYADVGIGQAIRLLWKL